jgi:hypothetical protein
MTLQLGRTRAELGGKALTENHLAELLALLASMDDLAKQIGGH